MQAIVGYILAYTLIGLVAGLISKRYMPGQVSATSTRFSLWGIAGALFGGLAGFAVIKYGWTQSQTEGTSGNYAGLNQGTGEPGLWVSLFAAALTALLVLAAYKLVKARDSQL